MRIAAAALLLAPLLVGSVPSGAAVPPNVKGMFVRSTASGPCYPGEPCDPPPQATFVVFTRSAHATRVRLAENGAFAVHLAPGLYTVSALPGRGSVTPSAVRVPRVGVIHPRLIQRTAAMPSPA
jgi:hypothetical protein